MLRCVTHAVGQRGAAIWGSRYYGGGVITYTANGTQKVAVASGFTHIEDQRT
jgi:hypothetical protein